MPSGGGFCGEVLDRNLGIFSRASARATGLSTGTMPFSPYSVSQSCSADIPTKDDHFIASTKDGLRMPSSTIESIETEQPMALAMMPSDLMTRPSPVTKVRGCFGSALRRGFGAFLRFMNTHGSR